MWEEKIGSKSVNFEFVKFERYIRSPSGDVEV